MINKKEAAELNVKYKMLRLIHAIKKSGGPSTISEIEVIVEEGISVFSALVLLAKAYWEA